MNKILSLLLLFLSGLYCAGAQENDALNMTLFDRLNPVRTDSVGPNSALWGYVAPNGREYALMGSQIGTHIIDITEKPIREITFIPGPKSTWREMKVYRNYAYIVTESTDPGYGLQIVDLSELPVRATLVRTDSTLFQRAHTVYVNSHYLYVMGTQADAGANGGAIIYDLEPDPTHPVRVGAVSPYYFHDAWERNDTLVGAAINGQGADIWDVRDRANPTRLAVITYPYSGTHNAEITSDGGFVVTSDEVGYTPKTMKVWDIHDLENISLAAEFTPGLTDIVHNVHVRGRYVIAAWYTAGVRIIDMNDPRHPREVGYYDTYPGPSGGFNGVWEAYGFFPSGKVIAGDRQTGLYVLQFNGATAGSVSGVVRNRITGDPLPGVTLKVQETNTTIVTDAQGRYYVGGPNGVTRTLSTAPFGFIGTTAVFTLAGDATQDILLDPAEFYSVTVMVRDRSGLPIDNFRYAVEPFIHSTVATGSSAQLMLPRDSSYMLTVGLWGYGIEHVPFQLTQNNQEILVTLRRAYQDDATLELGWSLQSPDDNATTGRWTRIVPYLGYPGSEWIHPPADATGRPGEYAFETGAPPINAPANLSDVNGVTTLTTPLMDLRSYVDATVQFDLWYVHYRADSLTDSIRVEVSSDDGGSWTPLYAEAEGRPGWKFHLLEIPETVPLTDRMRVRFRASDSASRQFIMAAVDNFYVNGGGEPAGVDNPENGKAGFTVVAIPNPMRAGGLVQLGLPVSAPDVRIALYNAVGRHSATLHAGALEAGEHRFLVPADLPAGFYTARVTAGAAGSRTMVFIVVR